LSHRYKLGTIDVEFDDAPTDLDNHRRHIEPWLAAVLQSEHLSLLLGNGFTTGIALAANAAPPSMTPVTFDAPGQDKVEAWALASAERAGRGDPTIEDQLRGALQLLGGLQILGHKHATKWEDAVRAALQSFAASVSHSEHAIREAIEHATAEGNEARRLLAGFMLTFGSRPAPRERLHLFTTNYDRLVEYGADLVGIRLLDRFVGGLTPVFRSSRLDVDLHYNPPGIRGEPRYLEGIIRFSKLHGSLDWEYDRGVVRRLPLPFGAESKPADALGSLMIYPNAAKDTETTQYPYAELFRDFAAAPRCRAAATCPARPLRGRRYPQRPRARLRHALPRLLPAEPRHRGTSWDRSDQPGR
jgi:hypothetical protein